MKDLDHESAPADDSWAYSLDDGEVLQWHRRPARGFYLRLRDVINYWPLLTIGFLFTLIPAVNVASFLMEPPPDINAFLPFWFSFHLVCFVTLQIGLSVWRNARQTSAHYSLTGSRAVVVNTWPFRSSREFALSHLSPGMIQDEVHVSQSKPRSIYFRRYRPHVGALQMARSGSFDYQSKEDSKVVYDNLQRMHCR